MIFKNFTHTLIIMLVERKHIWEIYHTQSAGIQTHLSWTWNSKLLPAVLPSESRQNGLKLSQQPEATCQPFCTTTPTISNYTSFIILIDDVFLTDQANGRSFDLAGTTLCRTIHQTPPAVIINKKGWSIWLPQTLVYLCLPLITRVYTCSLCIPPFTQAWLPVYPCLIVFTYVYNFYLC